MSIEEKNMQKEILFDPRTKFLILLICVLSATMAPNLMYELGLVLLISVFAFICGKTNMAIYGTIVYVIFYLLTMLVITHTSESTQATLLAFLGLVHKVYPCGLIGGILIETTKISEFLAAMTKLHVPKAITIPLAIMLRYIPTIKEDWHFIKDAMRLRDVSPSVGGILTHPARTLECLYVPLMIAASKAADELSIASVTRGIENPRQRTCLREIRFGIADLLAVICFIAYFVTGSFL